MKKIRIILYGITILILLSACTASDELMEAVDINDKTEQEFTVVSGSTAKDIAIELEKAGLVQKAYAFKRAVDKNNLAASLQAGKYKLSKSMTAEEIAQKIANGDVFLDLFSFTVPEGYDFLQIVDLLSEKKLIDAEKFKQIAENHEFDYPFLKTNPGALHRLEGFLYPATYQLPKGSDELTIIKAMLDSFNQHFKDEYYSRAEELGFTVAEIVTLASIIEKEAVIADEMPKISEVFHNRLADNYLLQADSTIQYVTRDKKERMLLSDLENDSPYNSYKFPGLTPAPICNPSEAAIKAALYPEEGKLYYFVVTGDNDGRHNFSITYEEHLKNQRSAEKKLGY